MLTTPPSAAALPDETPALAQPAPTLVRYQVIAMTVLLGMVTYLDRACISKLAPNIMKDLALTKVQMGWVFSAFALSYTLFALPAARIASRYGTRLLLTAMVLWWSVFTIGSAFAVGCASMIAIRFIFGIGEAGAWPCISQTFSQWTPVKDRGKAQGIAFTGAHLTGGLTPMLVIKLLDFMSWRSIFVCFGMVGFLWAAVWQRWFRDRPAEHSGVNAAELQLIMRGREEAPKTAGEAVGWEFWRRLAGSRNMRALCMAYFPNSFVFYFCITWLPDYLKEKHGFDAMQLGFLAGLPLILSVFGDLLGGILSDRVTAKWGRHAGRSGVGASANLASGLALLAVPFCHNPVLAAVLIAVSVGASMFMLGPAWGSCIDMGGKHAGVVAAAMNTTAQFGAMLCPLLVAYALKWYGSWDITIFTMAALFLIGAVAWTFIDHERAIPEES